MLPASVNEICNDFVWNITLASTPKCVQGISGFYPVPLAFTLMPSPLACHIIWFLTHLLFIIADVQLSNMSLVSVYSDRAALVL